MRPTIGNATRPSASSSTSIHQPFRGRQDQEALPTAGEDLAPLRSASLASFASEIAAGADLGRGGSSACARKVAKGRNVSLIALCCRLGEAKDVTHGRRDSNA